MEKRVPAWVIAVVWVLAAALALAASFFVLMLIAFGCDSGWEGCADVSANALFGYVGLAALSLVGPLVWAIVSSSRTQQIIACVLMPVGVILSVVLTFSYYAFMASRAGA